MGLENHSMFIMEDGSVKAVGSNYYGNLGLGHANHPVTDISEVSIYGVKEVLCGESQTIFLMEDGSVRAVGYNVFGNLGLGHTNHPVTQISDVPISGVKQVSCGSHHTMFLMEDGSVKAVGQNNNGQLGLGHKNTPVTQISLVPITNVKEISCGSQYTIFLMEDGSVKSVGDNRNGQLGIGHKNTPVTEISDVPISGVKQVSCGAYHTMFLMDDGSVKAVGYNSYGQLGLGHTNSATHISDVPISNVKQISCGYYHTFFLMEDGSVKGVGYNYYGQLGLGHSNHPILEILELSETLIGKVKTVITERFSTLFLMEDGSVKGIGDNRSGQLGLGHTTSPVTQISDVPLSNVKSMQNTISLTEVTRLFLFKQVNNILSYVDGSLTNIGAAPASESMFKESGLETITELPDELWSSFNSPFSILEYVENTGPTPLEVRYQDAAAIERNVETSAIPYGQLLIPKEDIEVGDIDSIELDASTSETGELRVVISGDEGVSWLGKNTVDLSDEATIKTNGFSLEEFQSISEGNYRSFFPNGKARFAFYLEKESLEDTVQINSLTINERQYTMTPSIENLNVLYSLLEAKRPTLYASRDGGGSWTEIDEDQLNDLSEQPEGNQLRIKALLEDGQEIHALSYSWI